MLLEEAYHKWRNQEMNLNEERRVKDRLNDLIAGGDYREADRVLLEYLAQGGQYDDILAIYDGDIGQNLGDSERTWAAICQGLCFDPGNYELYVMLGNYYLDENQEQSWLCYEHALACCQDQEDRIQIQEMLQQLTENCGVSAGRAAVVIWCHDGYDFVKQCVKSVRKALNGHSGQIVAVAGQCEEAAWEWLRQQKDLILVETEADQNMFQVWEKGIAAVWEDADCLLLDSCMILPKHALFWQRMALYGSREVGTAGSMSEHVTNSRLSDLVKDVVGSNGLDQLARRINVPMRYPCEVVPCTKGAAVLIRRKVLVQAGIPQERFVDGVFMDRDYGRKVEKAGYRNLLCENSFLLYQKEKAAGSGDMERNCCMSGERDGGRDGIFQASGGKPGTQIRRFLLFYAGNEKGYYQDTKYFTGEISRELCHRGHQTFICDLARGTHDAEALEAYLKKGVDAVLTFNGEAIQKEGLWQLWNQLGALVVNILMDPPFHMDLRPYMESPDMEQYLLLCPDENHVEYVKHYFPQVKHVEFMPHGGTPVEGRPIPWKEKRLDLLFSGTYSSPEAFLSAMRQTMKPEDFRIYASMGERILQDSSLSVEQVAADTLFSGNCPLTPGRIDGAISGMSLLDGWVRMVMRERVVMTLVEGGVDLYVLGDGWQNCPCAGNQRFHSLSEERIPLSDTLTWMENAKINLNVMPWFKAGSHDRVFNAMLRGTVALTDPSSYFQKYFRDRESIVYYSLQELERLPEIVRSLLAHPDQAETIARNGYEKAAAFTWENYVEDLLVKIEKCLG